MITKITKKVSLMAALALGLQANATHLGNQILLTARLNGAQQVPAITTNAVGVAAFSLNATRDTMCMSMTVSGLSGAVTGAHIHAGAAGTAGAVLVDLDGGLVGNSGTATITGANLIPALVSNYLRGLMYVNIHTAANPNGEIRGQIVPETDIEFVATLDGTQQTPPITTSAFGLATFALSKHNGKLMIRVVADGLSGTISGAHLHTGAIGAGGPVTLDLSSYIVGNTIIASVDPTAFLTDLMAGNIYLNLHTATNPNGEIRGQLMKDNKIAFDALLNGAQQTPAVTTNAMGLASFKLNTAMDSLWYDVTLTGLSSTASGAHLHNAAAGVSGAVVLDMTSDINGNRIMGMATGAAVTPLLSNMLKGNLYLNVHNTANPNGEIRGQVYRLLREGYTATIDGMQSMPMVTTNAHGTLVASVDRNQTDLHYMVVVDGITANGIHFHKGAMGQGGAVLFDITPTFANNGAFGYWKSTDASPFTTANSLSFRNDSVYVNLHTVANPNGEIRGQVERGYHCYTITTGIEENKFATTSITVFPNPVSNNLSVTFTENNLAKAQLQITDVQGRNIITQNVNVIAGQNKVEVDASKLTNGLYLLQLNIAGKPIVFTKLIKE